MALYLSPDKYREYLASDLVDRDDIEQVVEDCEADIISHYSRIGRDTRGTGLGEYDTILGYENVGPITSDVTVYLLFYETDPADVSTTDAEEVMFLDRFRREVAALVRWRIEQRDRTPGVEMERRGMRTVKYHKSSHAQLRPGFGSYLKPFDIRPAVYAV